MSFSVLQGFSKSLAMTVLSEIGDKTFFAAVMLAMHQPRRLVLAGCLAASIVMTILSALLGWAAPNWKPWQWIHHIAILLFFGFGLWTLWEGFTAKREDELAEVEAELDANMKAKAGTDSDGSKDNDLKKKRRPMLTQFFSPILLTIVTIGLAAEENPLGVVLGGILGQALCTTAAVLGGRSLAQISKRMVIHKFVFSGGILCLIFGIHSFLATRYILHTITT